METKHTPGPWSVWVDSCGVLDVRARPMHTVCDVVNPDEHVTDISADESRANARLIAAAPELLAKCKKIAAWLDRLAETAETAAKDVRFVTLADAQRADALNFRRTSADIKTVIAKAEGGAL